MPFGIGYSEADQKANKLLKALGLKFDLVFWSVKGELVIEFSSEEQAKKHLSNLRYHGFSVVREEPDAGVGYVVTVNVPKRKGK